MPGHAQSFKYPAGAGVGADGARGAVAVGLAVGLGAALKVIAFDAAGKALAFGNADNIDHISGFKQADINFLAGLYGRFIIQPEFPPVLEFTGSFSLSCPLRPVLVF